MHPFGPPDGEGGGQMMWSNDVVKRCGQTEAVQPEEHAAVHPFGPPRRLRLRVEGRRGEVDVHLRGGGQSPAGQITHWSNSILVKRTLVKRAGAAGVQSMSACARAVKAGQLTHYRKWSNSTGSGQTAQEVIIKQSNSTAAVKQHRKWSNSTGSGQTAQQW